MRKVKTISLAISPELLNEIDAGAKMLHLTRSAFISMVLSEKLYKEVINNGEPLPRRK